MAPDLRPTHEALVKWSVWLPLFAKARGLTVDQLFGMGNMAGAGARARFVPKQQQWVDLAVAGLYRTHRPMANVLRERYLNRTTDEECAARMAIGIRAYWERIRSARYAIAGALAVMESNDLTERALAIRGRHPKEQ